MKAIGIDIGTTTISGVMLDTSTGEVVRSLTLENDSAITETVRPYEKLQDPERILCTVRHIYHTFLAMDPEICAVGLTGQMHGVLYTDVSGSAVSPLYTWQDESGNQIMKDDPNLHTYAQKLSCLTGYSSASGFGITTLFCHTLQNLIPENAVSICTIPDYIAMALTGRTSPVTTPSLAASLGCFDLHALYFDIKAIRKAGIDPSLLPECDNRYTIVGYTQEHIPVSIAVGDNQASVIGSVRMPSDSVLINIGTGSQVSAGIRHFLPSPDMAVELRPLSGTDYLFVGASLCGGRAYAALEHFFSQTVAAMTGTSPSGKLYEQMNALLSTDSSASPPLADTRFCGTRELPSLTGSIQNLTLDNFTPAAFTKAILSGIAEELCTYHKAMITAGASTPRFLIGSGNGLRKNPYLQTLFEDVYQLPMQIPKHQEEAAYGCTLYAMCACGQKESLSEAQALIQYL